MGHHSGSKPPIRVSRIRTNTSQRHAAIAIEITFPRPRDNEPFAWGLSGSEPVEIWERFSPAYEAQLERLVVTLRDLGFAPTIGGAGSEDGEYVRAEYRSNSRIVFFYHLVVGKQRRSNCE